MKKSPLILVVLSGLFFLIPFINFSTAVPPAYIGVQVGEEYGWTLGINVNTITNYFTDMGQTPPDLSGFTGMTSIQTKGVVEYISDEYPGATYDYVLINLSIWMNAPGYGWMQYPLPGGNLPIMVLPDDTPNYFNNTVDALNTEVLPPEFIFCFAFLIVPYNLNWTLAVQGVQTLIDFISPGLSSLIITQFGNGFKVTVPAQSVGDYNMQAMEFTAQWNSKGVFGQGGIAYGGSAMVTINAPDEIPGYELPILLGVLGAGSLGIIVYVRKKR